MVPLPTVARYYVKNPDGFDVLPRVDSHALANLELPSIVGAQRIRRFHLLHSRVALKMKPVVYVVDQFDADFAQSRKSLFFVAAQEPATSERSSRSRKRCRCSLAHAIGS
jgi:hypothetical protein